MGRARRNPIGTLAPKGVDVVLLGSGEHTHIFHPVKQHVICNSGKGRSLAPQVVYDSKANYVTCYRCQKLAMMNLSKGREAWQAEGE